MPSDGRPPVADRSDVRRLSGQPVALNARDVRPQGQLAMRGQPARQSVAVDPSEEEVGALNGAVGLEGAGREPPQRLLKRRVGGGEGSPRIPGDLRERGRLRPEPEPQPSGPRSPRCGNANRWELDPE